MNNLQEQARALYKRGEYQKAIGFFDRAIGKAPSVQLLDNRAACYEKLGELSTALKDAKKAIQLHREDATGYLRAGKVLVKMDKESVALEIYTYGLKSIKHVGQGYELLRTSHKNLMDKLSPPRSVDPLTVLPRELAEMVLEYLSFRQRINACLVTKEWARFIRSSPNLWAHLDLSSARKRVRNAFISKAINIAKTKLTAATLNNLWDFDKAVAALIKFCPLEELTLLSCGLHGKDLTDAVSKAKHLKKLKLGNGTQLQAFQLQHLLHAISERIESFHCNINPGGQATIDGATCRNLKTLSFSFWTSNGLTTLLANISTRMPALTSLTLQQIEATPISESGIHMGFDKCSHLEHLDLRLRFTSTSLLTLPPSLTVLKLDSIAVPRPGEFFRPMSIGVQQPYYLPRLQELTMTSHVTDTDIHQFLLWGHPGETQASEPPTKPSKLRKFHICSSESAENLVLLLCHERLSELEHLSLAGSQGCTDNVVCELRGGFSKLRTLDLSETEITGCSIKYALEAPHLEKLFVNNCRHIGFDAIDWARLRGIRVEHRMSDSTSGGKKVRY